MQKKLLSTTALVAAGALTVPFMVDEASAAEPMSLSIGGYFSTGVQISDQDDGPGQPAANTQEVSVHTDGEIQFTASTTLDNGIEVSARIEYEAQNQGGGSSTVDERYVTFKGDFGQLRIGSDDPVTSPMHYQAPVGAYQMGVNTPTFAVPNLGSVFTAFTGSYPTTYADWSSDGGAIIYYSPRMAGFQLGLSYQPDGSRSPIDNVAFIPADNNGQEDVVAAAVNYVNSFDGIDVAASAGYIFGSDEVGISGVTDDREAFNAGLNVGFSGFTVGASYRQDNYGLDGNFDQTVWDVGVTYSTGPWTIGVTYLSWNQEIDGFDDAEIDGVSVGGTYNLGPGVDLWAGVKWLDHQWEGDPTQENEALFGMIGTSVSF